MTRRVEKAPDILVVAQESLEKFRRLEHELLEPGAFDRALALVRNARECLDAAEADLGEARESDSGRGDREARMQAIRLLAGEARAAELAIDDCLADMARRIGRKGV